MPYLQTAAQYMRKGLSVSTLKSYDSAWSHFSSFCAALSTVPIPANIACVSAFIVHCFESRNMQPSSIKSTIAGIQFHLRCTDPSTIGLLENLSIRLLLNGLKKQNPQGNDCRLPMTPSLLQTIISRLREGCFCHYSDLLMETMLLTAFYGFLRGGEFCTRTIDFNPAHHLTISDVGFHSHYFTLFLKHSKADRDGNGACIYVSETNDGFCPLSSMSAYMRSRPGAGQLEPLFLTSEGKPVSRAWFAAHLRLLCQHCGLPLERYTAHSLRIGAATTAAATTPISTLKAMGRWSSSAYERYLRPDARAILNAQKAMSAASLLCRCFAAGC